MARCPLPCLHRAELHTDIVAKANVQEEMGGIVNSSMFSCLFGFFFIHFYIVSYESVSVIETRILSSDTSMVLMLTLDWHICTYWHEYLACSRKLDQ